MVALAGLRAASELEDQDAVVEAATFGALVAARTVERAGASPPFLHELGLAEPPAPVTEP